MPARWAGSTLALTVSKPLLVVLRGQRGRKAAAEKVTEGFVDTVFWA